MGKVARETTRRALLSPYQLGLKNEFMITSVKYEFGYPLFSPSTPTHLLFSKIMQLQLSF
jgi:hypothetical protein